MKIFFIGIILIIAAACTTTTIDSSTIKVHGHSSEIIYEITIPTNQVEQFLKEEGTFSCNGEVCHID